MINHLTQRALSLLMIVSGIIMSLWTIYNIDTRFFPVVRDFKVEYIRKEPDGGFTAGGTLVKSKPCEFLGLTIYGVKNGTPKLLVAQFKKDIFGSDVGQGYQSWGPWTVRLPPALLEMDQMEIMGTHRCNGMWVQSTVYTTFDLKALPK